jgi:hypothetical protein
MDRCPGEDSDLLLSFHAEEDLSVMTTDIRSPDAAVPNFLKEYFFIYLLYVFEGFLEYFTENIIFRQHSTTYFNSWVENYLFCFYLNKQWENLKTAVEGWQVGGGGTPFSLSKIIVITMFDMVFSSEISLCR